MYFIDFCWRNDLCRLLLVYARKVYLPRYKPILLHFFPYKIYDIACSKVIYNIFRTPCYIVLSFCFVNIIPVFLTNVYAHLCLRYAVSNLLWLQILIVKSYHDYKENVFDYLHLLTTYQCKLLKTKNTIYSILIRVLVQIIFDIFLNGNTVIEITLLLPPVPTSDYFSLETEHLCIIIMI